MMADGNKDHYQTEKDNLVLKIVTKFHKVVI